MRQLITNRAVLNASDDVLAPAQLRTEGDTVIWTAASVTSANTRYVAIFNAPAKASSASSAEASHEEKAGAEARTKAKKRPKP